MNAKTLIEQVNACKSEYWQNSDLGKNSEEMLEKIAKHFETCAECRKQFDAQEYPEETIIDFEDRLTGTELSDWICEPNRLAAIKIIKEELKPRYEFPYYALIRIHTRHYGTIHIPAPQFDGLSRRSRWAGNLPIAPDKRDGEYYQCPFCGVPSFFAGVCQDCRSDFEVWVSDEDYGNDGSWEDGPLPREYGNHEALKCAVKKEFLRRLDSGVPDLGIESAEIVLPVEWGYECNVSPFLKTVSFAAEQALYCLENNIFTPNNYKQGDEIIVEGSDEVRRQVNGVWQHKHESHDYWHPMARVHPVRNVESNISR